MANQYIVAKRDAEDSMGIIGISIRVFESIAELALEDIKNVKVVPNSGFRKSTTCEVVDDKIVISMKVACKIGANVNNISSEIQKKVIEAISNNTDFTNIIVNVNIVSFFAN